MIDPFDVSKSPLGEPLGIVTGGSAQWRREIDIDDTLHTLQYVTRRFDPTEAGDSEDLTAQVISMTNVDGSCWGVDILAADTTDWVNGRFFWDLVVTRTSDSRTKVIDTGEFYVFGSDDDRRSHAQVMIGKIESILQGRADNDVESYSIKSRSITKMGVSDLRKWRDYYIRELEAQQPMDAGVFRSREPNKTTLRVRFRD